MRHPTREKISRFCSLCQRTAPFYVRTTGEPLSRCIECDNARVTAARLRRQAAGLTDEDLLVRLRYAQAKADIYATEATRRGLRELPSFDYGRKITKRQQPTPARRPAPGL